MTFRTMFKGLNRQQLIDVAANHVAFLLAVDANLQKVFTDASKTHDSTEKLEILEKAVSHAFP